MVWGKFLFPKSFVPILFCFLYYISFCYIPSLVSVLYELQVFNGQALPITKNGHIHKHGPTLLFPCVD